MSLNNLILGIYGVAYDYCLKNQKKEAINPLNLLSSLAACTGEAALWAAGLFVNGVPTTEPLASIEDTRAESVLLGDSFEPPPGEAAQTIFGVMLRDMFCFNLSTEHAPSLEEIRAPFQKQNSFLLERFPLAVDELFRPSILPLVASFDLREKISALTEKVTFCHPLSARWLGCTEATLMSLTIVRGAFDGADEENDRRIAQRIAFGTIWGAAHTGPLTPDFVRRVTASGSLQVQ